MVSAVWIYSFCFLERAGIFQNFRLALIGSPLVVMILVGIRYGLILGAVNIIFIIAAVWATHTGYLPQASPPWTPEDFWGQSMFIVGSSVPQLFLLAWFSHHLATAIRREKVATARLRSDAVERERLENEVLEAGEKESLRIGHELHDGVCQDLTGLLIRSKRTQNKLAAQQLPEAEALAGIVLDLGNAIGEIHDLSKRLSPGLLTGRNLAGAIEALVRQSSEIADSTIQFRVDGRGPVPGEQATLHLFRIAQEALSNAIRHARAGRIEVLLSHAPTEILLRIDDDGQGLAPDAELRDGLGLKTMRWRAGKAGGALAVTHRPGGGTRVECRIPFDENPQENEHDA
ncbi:MAG TPA: ATP-binding protein [bacterium]|nr:ATP-binding protein [bacterium]